MKTIVVSAVNLRKGGTLTILKDCLGYLSELACSGEYRVIALVHKESLVKIPHVEYIEMPWCVKSWILRLWCEYITMYRVSRQLSPIYLWLSLHDTTPNVRAERKAVYCHNPFAFYPWKWKELLLNYRIVCFAWFTKYIYRINIHRNDYILVQQQWIRRRFTEIFGVPEERIIVTRPANGLAKSDYVPKVREKGLYSFLFPSFGDIHKNFDLLCEATSLLEKEIGDKQFEVVLTISGTESTYTRMLYDKWGSVSSLRFVGFLDKDKLEYHYNVADALVFPSKVETWGLPITEFARYGKPMLLADQPYAYETAAGCNSVAFFSTSNACDLAAKMKKLIYNDTSFLGSVPEPLIKQPTTSSWQELFGILLK